VGLPGNKAATHLLRKAALYRELISVPVLIVVMLDPHFFRHFFIALEKRLDPNTGPQLHDVQQCI
jgi:hypothetical protein